MPTTTKQNPRHAGARLSASDPACDGDTYTSGDFTPTTIARGFHPNANGNLIVDWAGGIEGRTPGTNQTLVVVAGVQVPGFFTKIYNGSVAGIILY